MKRMDTKKPELKMSLSDLLATVQDAKQLQITMCLVVEIQNWNLTQLLHSIGNIQSMEFCLEPIIKLTF